MIKTGVPFIVDFPSSLKLIHWRYTAGIQPHPQPGITSTSSSRRSVPTAFGPWPIWLSTTQSSSEALLFRAVEILTEFRNQNLSNFIWAFAKLGHKDEETTVKVLELSRERLMTFSPQDRTEVALQFVMSISEVLALPRSTFGFRVSSKFFG